MLAIIFGYILGVVIIITFNYVSKLKFKDIEGVKVVKDGLVFFSKSQHRLRVDNAKYLIVDNDIFIKYKKKSVILNNVRFLTLKKGYLHFKALGNVKISMNCIKFYKYFNIVVKSEKFNLDCMKTLALKGLINNIFNPYKSKEFKHYLRVLIYILNIHIDYEKITVGKNKYKLNYDIEYKLNGKKKVVKIK